MPLNPMAMQLIQLIRSGKNPQQLVMGILSNQAQGNPVAENLLTMAKNGDGEGIESVARNLFKEQGLDFDKEFNSFRQSLGI